MDNTRVDPSVSDQDPEERRWVRDHLGQSSFRDWTSNNKGRNLRATAASRLQTNTLGLDKQDRRPLIRSPNKADPGGELCPHSDIAAML